MLRHTTGHVGMMMLHRNQELAVRERAVPRFGTLPCVSGGRIIRMPIVDNLHGFKGEKLLIKADVSLESTKGCVVIEIAQVMAEKSMPPVPERERGLQLPSDREDRMRAVEGQADRARSVSPRSSHRRLRAVHDTCHRVVAANVDRSVVNQEQVGNLIQTVESVVALRRRWARPSDCRWS